MVILPEILGISVDCCAVALKANKNNKAEIVKIWLYLTVNIVAPKRLGVSIKFII